MDVRMSPRRRVWATPARAYTAAALVAAVLLAVPAAALAHGGADAWDLQLQASPTGAGEVAPLRFDVRDTKKRPVVRYTSVHERELHAWLVRVDEDGNLDGFQHVHPSRVGASTWEFNDMRLDEAGTWSLITDITSGKVAGFGFAAFDITGTSPDEPRQPDDRGVVARVLSVEEGEEYATIRVRVSDASGAPIEDVQEHIGAPAHWSSFTVGTDSVDGAVHAHAMGLPDEDGVMTFMAYPPAGGTLDDVAGGWIELRSESRGVAQTPLRPNQIGSQPGDGIMLRARTMLASAGAIGDGGSTDSMEGHSMEGMDHG